MWIFDLLDAFSLVSWLREHARFAVPLVIATVIGIILLFATPSPIGIVFGLLSFIAGAAVGAFWEFAHSRD